MTFEFYGRSYEEISTKLLSKTLLGNTNQSVFANKFRTMWESESFRCSMSSLDCLSSWSEAQEGRIHWIKKENVGSMKEEKGGYITMSVDLVSNTVKLYFDGNYVDQTTCDHNWIIGGDLNNPEIPFTIALMCGGDEYTEIYSKMDLYACRLYNKVLTDEEVKDNYNKTVAYHNSQIQ